jgi:uncharacterized membrane protein YeaQ/YmgE (transglycosylase-associated protein family)
VTDDDAARPRRLADRLFGAPAAPGPARPEPERQQAPRSVRWAAVVVVIEALLAVFGALLLGWLLAFSTAVSTRNAVAEIVFALVGAALLLVCARGLWRLSSWARGPVVALQLILALLGFTTAFQGNAPRVGVPILVLAAAELYLLATPEARSAFVRSD